MPYLERLAYLIPIELLPPILTVEDLKQKVLPHHITSLESNTKAICLSNAKATHTIQDIEIDKTIYCVHTTAENPLYTFFFMFPSTEQNYFVNSGFILPSLQTMPV